MWKPAMHYRLASKKLGDDATLTRYVRVDGAKGVEKRARKRQPRLPTLAPAYVQQGRTKFRKRVKRIDEMPHILTSGHSNVKIGRDVRKGRFKGYWIYTLSLEERATCPRSCEHWQSCYGNNMPFAKRVDHTDPKFLPALEAELDVLLAKHKIGVLVRLHALGDFYSASYVDFWIRMLRKHPRLAIYGYTARIPKREPVGVGFAQMVTDIGDLVVEMNRRFKGRSMVRLSNGGTATMSTVTIADPSSRPDNAFVCPEQTGQTRCCATCGACWSTVKNVAFIAH